MHWFLLAIVIALIVAIAPNKIFPRDVNDQPRKANDPDRGE